MTSLPVRMTCCNKSSSCLLCSKSVRTIIAMMKTLSMLISLCHSRIRCSQYPRWMMNSYAGCLTLSTCVSTTQLHSPSSSGPWQNIASKSHSMCSLCSQVLVGGCLLRFWTRQGKASSRDMEGSLSIIKSQYIPMTKYHITHLLLIHLLSLKVPSNKECPLMIMSSVCHLPEWQHQNLLFWPCLTLSIKYWFLSNLCVPHDVYVNITNLSILVLYTF